MMTETINPYETAFADYFNAGWRGILPIPYQKKTWPPKGYTGHDGIDTSFADCMTFAQDGLQNIALRIPRNAVGIDVDNYGDKNGAQTLAELCSKYGALPPTIMSTSRTDGMSGIRLYSIPVGAVLPGAFPGIEVIQYHHRYAVVWPSVHPDDGRVYQWVDEITGDVVHAVPNVNALPALPSGWLTGLVVEERERATKADIDGAAMRDILAGMPEGAPCAHVLKAAGNAFAGNDRHDSYNNAVLAVLGAGRRGCPGAVLALGRLHAGFVAEVSDPVSGRVSKAEAQAEWHRGFDGALRMIARETQGVACPDDVFDYVESLPNADFMDAPVVVNPLEKMVKFKFAELLILDDAKAMLAVHKAGVAPPLGGHVLTQFLAQVEPEERYVVKDLWPAQGRVLLAAQAKSGKTTMVVANLLPVLVDGGLFLGRYEAHKPTGRIVYLNMEVGTRTMRRWLHDARIVNTEQITVANLRGMASALTLVTDSGRRRFGQWLRDLGAQVVVLDPLAPALAAFGLDENSNSDVARFFGYWSEALALGGVVDDVIVHHAGHGGERSRGASRLLDEPDAIWTLTKDANVAEESGDVYGAGSPTRYLSAYGRDVELPAESLAFDSVSRRLTLTGVGRSAVKSSGESAKILGLFADGMPRSVNAMVSECKINRNKAWDLVKVLQVNGVLEEVGKTSNNRPLWLPAAITETS